MTMPFQNAKVQGLFVGQTVTSGGTVTSGTIDALNAGVVSIFLSAYGATTGAVPGTVRVQHSDTDTASNFANIDGYTANTSSSGYPAAIRTTSATNVVFGAFHVNMVGKKRYLRLLVDGPPSSTHAATVAAWAILGRNAADPVGTNSGAQFVVNPA